MGRHCFLRFLRASAMASLALALGAAGTFAQQRIAVRGQRVHPVSGPAIEDGVVLISDGKIEAVDVAARLPIPDGYLVLEAAVVVPGLIDAHATVGLTGYLNQDGDQDHRDEGDPMQPELRAIDSYDGRERLLEWVRERGITTVHTGHSPGALITGQTMVCKTRGATIEASVLVPFAMVAATLGEGATVSESDGKGPGTRSKAVALLRQQLIQAAEYVARREQGGEKQPDRDLRLEALVEVLDGTAPLLVTVHRASDILTALRLQREFRFRLVLDGACEAYLVLDEIRAAGVPVIAHPPMMRAFGEKKNATFELAARLRAAGIQVALQSGYESYVPKTRVLLFEAAIAAAHGLGMEGALRAVTLDAATILGVQQRIGSLEPGKDADLALYDGDPFEYTSHCLAVLIDGELVSRGAR